LVALGLTEDPALLGNEGAFDEGAHLLSALLSEGDAAVP
jgi:hypothetical protein